MMIIQKQFDEKLLPVLDKYCFDKYIKWLLSISHLDILLTEWNVPNIPLNDTIIYKYRQHNILVWDKIVRVFQY